MPNTSNEIIAQQRADKLLAQRRKILALPPEEALNAILDEPQALPLVHSMAPPDLHLLIHDIGPDDAVALLTLASNRQWDYVLDREVWQRDRLDSLKVVRWLRRLAEADGRRLGDYLLDHQGELLSLHLFRNVMVYIREHDQEASDFPDDTFTLDGQFYIRIRDIEGLEPEADAARRLDIKELLTKLAARDHAAYQKILLVMAAVLPAEVEEEGFRLRNVRLAESGVMPYHEAIGIYQPLSRQKVAALARTARPRKKGLRSQSAVPVLPQDLLPPDKLLAQALAQIDSSAIRDRIHQELAFLGNAAVIADQVRLTGRHDLQAVVYKVVNYITMGLEHLAGGTLTAAEAGGWLERVALADLFRVGHGLLVEIHQRAKAWVAASWFHSQGLALNFWDESYMGVLGGGLLKRPRFYDPQGPEGMYRDFESLHEVQAVDKVLAELLAFDDLFRALDLTTGQHSAEEGYLTYKNLLLTLWARQVGGNSDHAPVPLEKEQFQPILEMLFETPGAGQTVTVAAQAHFWSWLAGRSEGQPAAELKTRLGSAVDALFVEIADELGRLTPGHFDLRYIRLFLIKSYA